MTWPYDTTSNPYIPYPCTGAGPPPPPPPPPPPCVPKGIKLGFDGAFWYDLTIACTCEEYVELLSEDISKISQCGAVFCGVSDSCGQTTSFDPSQFAAIGAWVAAGGRLWCNGEFGRVGIEGGFSCIEDTGRDKINSLMAGIGSSLQLKRGVCNCACTKDNGDPWLGVNGPAKILSLPSSLPGVYHACTAEVGGGTIVSSTNAEPFPSNPQELEDYNNDPTNNKWLDRFKCTESFPFIAIQKIGAGVVLLTGDCNITALACNWNNCALIQRFIFNPISDLV